MLILETETGRATQRDLIGQKWSLEELGKAPLVNPDSWEAEAEEALRPIGATDHFSKMSKKVS